MKISIEKIIVSKDNPRQSFDEEGLRRLGESIKAHGQLQAGIVRPKGSMYELVVGERRLRACALVGISEFEAEVRDIDDITAMELRLIENTHREDLTNAEKGDAVLALWAFDKYETIKDVADAIQIPYITVWNVWVPKSRKLSQHVKELIARHELTERASQYLLKYSHPTQDKLAKAIIKFDIRGGRHGAERTFIKLYDTNPKRPLEELANEALGKKQIAVPADILTEEQKHKLAEEKTQLAKIRKVREPQKRITKQQERKRLGLYSPTLESQMKKTDFKFEKVKVTRGIKGLEPMPPAVIKPTITPLEKPPDYSLCKCAFCPLYGKHCKGRCWG